MRNLVNIELDYFYIDTANDNIVVVDDDGDDKKDKKWFEREIPSDSRNCGNSIVIDVD